MRGATNVTWPLTYASSVETLRNVSMAQGTTKKAAAASRIAAAIQGQIRRFGATAPGSEIGDGGLAGSAFGSGAVSDGAALSWAAGDADDAMNATCVTKFGSVPRPPLP